MIWQIKATLMALVLMPSFIHAQRAQETFQAEVINLSTPTALSMINDLCKNWQLIKTRCYYNYVLLEKKWFIITIFKTSLNCLFVRSASAMYIFKNMCKIVAPQFWLISTISIV